MILKKEINRPEHRCFAILPKLIQGRIHEVMILSRHLWKYNMDP